MHIHNLDEILIAIEDHTALKVAGVKYPERLMILEDRVRQIGGMIELARRLPLSTLSGTRPKLLRFLEDHRDRLKREIEGE